MISNYRVISISHQTLEVNEIGQFVIPCDERSELLHVLEQIKQEFRIEELQYLSTCNRLEFIMFSHIEPDHHFLTQLFHRINPNLGQHILDKIENFVTVYQGEQALSHIMEVASSLDSLVVGEREIFRQYRASFKEANSHKLSKEKLRLLEKAVVVASKKIYSETKIGEKSLSIVALAIEEMMKRTPDLNARILMLGAGETNALVLKFLKKKGFENITVFNRTLDNASKLSELYQVKAAHLSSLKNWDQGFDIIIACTGATQAVLTEDIYKVLLKREQGSKMLIDLAVPRNIEAAIVAHYDTDYISIDALRNFADANLKTRKSEMGHARKIIKEHLTLFIQEYQQRQIQKVLTQVPKEIKAIKHKVLEEKYKKEIDLLDDRTRELIHEMMNYMEKSCVSVPMRLAKESVVE